MARLPYKSTFFCNRHTRLCTEWYNHVKRDLEYYIKTWGRMIKSLPSTRNHSSIKVRRLSGQQCLQLNAVVRRPYHVDLRRNPVLHVTQLLNCMSAAPPLRSKLDIAIMDDRVVFWQTAWGKIYHDTRAVLPASVAGLTAGVIRQVAVIIDRHLWGKTLLLVFPKKHWSFHTKANHITAGDIGMNPSDSPLAGISVHVADKTLSGHCPGRCPGQRPRVTLWMERDHRMWPSRYPFNCDGYPVSNWREYMVHTVAHELLHCFRVAMDIVPTDAQGRKKMYDETYSLLNLWINGHFEWQDKR